MRNENLDKQLAVLSRLGLRKRFQKIYKWEIHIHNIYDDSSRQKADIAGSYMKKKIIGLALFALCIFLFATLRDLRCTAKAENSNNQPSRLQITLTPDLIEGKTSMIEPCSPGSGGGRGPGSIR